MSLIDDVKGLFARPAIKQPSFPVSNFPTFLDYSILTDSYNYLDQYNGWTYKAIKTKADAVVNYSHKLKKEKGKDVTELDRKTSDLLNDLMAFNPHQTYQEARKITWLHMGLAGIAYWYMVQSDEKNHKVEFYILDPMRVGMTPDAFGLPAGYVYTDASGGQHNIKPEDIIVFREPNPKNWLKGYSPLEASRYAHNSFELAMKFNLNVFGNSGRPDGFILAEGVTDDQRKALEQQLKQKYGGVGNARKIGVVNTLFKWLEIGKTPKDLDFVKGLEVMRDQILSIHGVPKTLVGIEDSTFANAEQAQRTFQLYTLKPMLELECSVYNEQLIKNYYRMRDVGEIYFDYENPVEIDKKQLVETTALAFEKTILKRNEARALLGYTPLDEAEDGFYKIQGQNNQATMPQNSPDLQKLIDSTSEIKKKLADDLPMSDIEAKRLESMKKMFWEKSMKDEGRMWQLIDKYFAGQAGRVVGALRKAKAVTMKAEINSQSEIDIAVELFTELYNELAKEANDIANNLTGDKIQLENNVKEQLKKNIEYFAKEINATTRDDLQKIIADAIEQNLPLKETAQKVLDLFNGYVEGKDNIDTLKKLGVYEPKSTIGNDGQIVVGSINRYNKMLENITKNLKGDQQKEALLALAGILDPADPLYNSIKDTLNTIYGINEKQIPTNRAKLIVRTETNKIKNQISRDNYSRNKHVKSMTWLTAHDNFVRGLRASDQFNHVDADGQTVPKGVKFNVSGEFLAYPSDPAGSAGNIINCRCTIVPNLE